MAISGAEISAAVEVTPEQIKHALPSGEAIIRTNGDAMLVADSVNAKVFRIAGSNLVHAPFDTKIG